MNQSLIDKHSFRLETDNWRNIRDAIDWCSQNLKNRRAHPTQNESLFPSNGDWAVLGSGVTSLRKYSLSFWFANYEDKIQFVLIFG